MAQRALPEREARLGRPTGATDTAPQAVVLVLPGGGAAHSARRTSAVAAASALTLARRVTRSAHRDGVVSHVLHYRYRGWNDEAAHPAQDAEWAVEEAVRRYGDVAVSLVGTDVGARAALRAAGHPAVASVLALALWLPEGAHTTEPVRQLVGRQVLMVHGTDDAHSDPEYSFRYAERVKKVNSSVCRFEVHTDGHGLRRHSAEVAALARDFVLGTLCARDFARPLVDAMAAPPPLGLRMPLASGFGRTLR
ncbi:alpha/beta hydrolase [Streptomyces boncukensis]|uniref:Alpha/beta hydrolase n=1 Tax=Streptomyces boncukensis TaxID=2711219 RepID=A0A6G4WSV5_9ACTN|nr:alpha/beta hydrolase [Streptomyces boncukensis]NGO68285.1 alpha/beta hydrolase [Streptomyces boncukensis]